MTSGTEHSATESQPASAFWTLDRVADALATLLISRGPAGTHALHAVSTDTRSIAPGDIFVALAGPTFDAHDFLSQAVQSGAAALVVSSPPPIGSVGVPVFHVSDTLRALGALARYRRIAWGGPVVGVAGSNGKTTTKDLIRAAVGAVLKVHATTGNLNNLVGVPLTLLAIPDEADVAVIEIGTNVPGEVGRLRDIAQPDIAVVTSVGEEHLEGLGGMQEVLREETSIYEGVTVAVAPSGQPEIVAAARALARRVVTAGLEDGDLAVGASEIGPDGLGSLTVDGVVVRPPVRGAHNLRNAALALAVARECGVSMTDAARGIAAMPVPSMRMAWETIGSATLINDAYNANPPSMRAAIDLLSGAGNGRQRVAVLGTMREMGAHAERVHTELAKYALASRADVIGAVGDMAVALVREGANDPRVVTATDVQELWAILKPRLAPDAVILLKASRGVRLERLIPMLTEWAG
ncbi:MAG: UDP-N-acetylmuramoyl-tripeptide--D-alanyl-D-alanine ligase [Anaerolineae bacterium]|nr:UDP-N-acetylmuramoyl-tripeptide--D-alanyl-D-alanine ligase [Gemmatimonadaceae bacterium]